AMEFNGLPNRRSGKGSESSIFIGWAVGRGSPDPARGPTAGLPASPLGKVDEPVGPGARSHRDRNRATRPRPDCGSPSGRGPGSARRCRVSRTVTPNLPRAEMPLNIRIDGDVVVLSNFARLMNDPRYVDARGDVRDLLDEGRRNFVLDLGGVRETGSSFLGLLMTLTRLVRQQKGEVVLAHLSRELERVLLLMQLDDHWDVFPSVREASGSFRRGSPGTGADPPDPRPR